MKKKKLAFIVIGSLFSLLMLSGLWLLKQEYFNSFLQQIGIKVKIPGVADERGQDDSDAFQKQVTFLKGAPGRSPASEVDIDNDDSSAQLNLDEQLQFALAGGALAPQQKEEFIRDFKAMQLMAKEKRQLEETEVFDQ